MGDLPTHTVAPWCPPVEVRESERAPLRILAIDGDIVIPLMIIPLMITLLTPHPS